MGSIWVGGVCYLWSGLAPGRALRGVARHVRRYSTLVSAVGFALLGRTVCICLVEAVGTRASAGVLCAGHSWGGRQSFFVLKCFGSHIGNSIDKA